MFSEPIELYDAVITAIHHKIQDGNVTSRLQITGTLSPGLADELDIRSLVFARNDTPKEGFVRLELATGCGSYRAVFEAPAGLKQSFEIVGDSTEHYLVERQAEGVLKLKLRMHFDGDPYHALAFVKAVGTAESAMKIVPLQASLLEAMGPEDEDDEEDEGSITIKRPDGTVQEDSAPLKRGRGRPRKDDSAPHRTRKAARQN